MHVRALEATIEDKESRIASLDEEEAKSMTSAKQISDDSLVARTLLVAFGKLTAADGLANDGGDAQLDYSTIKTPQHVANLRSAFGVSDYDSIATWTRDLHTAPIR